MNHDDDTKSAESLIEFLNGWVHMELVSGHPVPDDSLPFRRGSLIRIKKSPRPDKIPDDAIAMFIDYNWSTYRVLKAEIGAAEEHIKKIQYRMKVLFDERVVELLNAKPEELGENYVKITNSENSIEIPKGLLGLQFEEPDSW